MPSAASLVPPELAAGHVLLVPDTAPAAPALERLAAAWFPEAGWAREPAAAATARPPTGARFRGHRAAPPAVPAAGVLRLGAEHVAVGPFPVDAERAAAVGASGGAPARAYAVVRADGQHPDRGPGPSSYDDRDGIARAFAAGLPGGEELRTVRWAVAVARKTGGVVLADGRTALVPDPAAAVDLSLFSAHALPPAELLATMRHVAPTAEVEPQGVARRSAVRCTLVARTPYDGSLVVRVEQVERVPPALAALDWRTYGPFAYRIEWLPQDPYELESERPSGLHLIARGRMRSAVARLATALQGRVTGTVLDDGGFVATTQEVAARLDPRAGVARAWV